MRIALLFGIVAAPVWCQSAHLGIKVGVPITQYFETGSSGGLHGGADYSAATRRYTFGASFEWRLTDAFGLEVDALYHRMGYVAIVNSFDSAHGSFGNSAIDVKGNSWDFPLVLRYRFGHVARPYVLGGGVVRYVGPVRGRGYATVGSLVDNSRSTTLVDTGEPSELRKRVYPGLTVGAGLELPAGRVHLLPELRYVRWTANIAGAGGLVRFAPNQVEFIVGVAF